VKPARRQALQTGTTSVGIREGGALAVDQNKAGDRGGGAGGRGEE